MKRTQSRLRHLRAALEALAAEDSPPRSKEPKFTHRYRGMADPPIDIKIIIQEEPKRQRPRSVNSPISPKRKKSAQRSPKKVSDAQIDRKFQEFCKAKQVKRHRILDYFYKWRCLTQKRIEERARFESQSESSIAPDDSSFVLVISDDELANSGFAAPGYRRDFRKIGEKSVDDDEIFVLRPEYRAFAKWRMKTEGRETWRREIVGGIQRALKKEAVYRKRVKVKEESKRKSDHRKKLVAREREEKHEPTVTWKAQAEGDARRRENAKAQTLQKYRTEKPVVGILRAGKNKVDNERREVNDDRVRARYESPSLHGKTIREEVKTGPRRTMEEAEVASRDNSKVLSVLDVSFSSSDSGSEQMKGSHMHDSGSRARRARFDLGSNLSSSDESEKDDGSEMRHGSEITDMNLSSILPHEAAPKAGDDGLQDVPRVTSPGQKDSITGPRFSSLLNKDVIQKGEEDTSDLPPVEYESGSSEDTPMKAQPRNGQQKASTTANQFGLSDSEEEISEKPVLSTVENDDSSNDEPVQVNLATTKDLPISSISVESPSKKMASDSFSDEDILAEVNEGFDEPVASGATNHSTKKDSSEGSNEAGKDTPIEGLSEELQVSSGSEGDVIVDNKQAAEDPTDHLGSEGFSDEDVFGGEDRKTTPDKTSLAAPDETSEKEASASYDLHIDVVIDDEEDSRKLVASPVPEERSGSSSSDDILIEDVDTGIEEQEQVGTVEGEFEDLSSDEIDNNTASQKTGSLEGFTQNAENRSLSDEDFVDEDVGSSPPEPVDSKLEQPKTAESESFSNEDIFVDVDEDAAQKPDLSMDNAGLQMKQSSSSEDELITDLVDHTGSGYLRTNAVSNQDRMENDSDSPKQGSIARDSPTRHSASASASDVDVFLDDVEPEEPQVPVENSNTADVSDDMEIDIDASGDDNKHSDVVPQGSPSDDQAEIGAENSGQVVASESFSEVDDFLDNTNDNQGSISLESPVKKEEPSSSSSDVKKDDAVDDLPSEEKEDSVKIESPAKVDSDDFNIDIDVDDENSMSIESPSKVDSDVNIGVDEANSSLNTASVSVESPSKVASDDSNIDIDVEDTKESQFAAPAAIESPSKEDSDDINVDIDIDEENDASIDSPSKTGASESFSTDDGKDEIQSPKEAKAVQSSSSSEALDILVEPSSDSGNIPIEKSDNDDNNAPKVGESSSSSEDVVIEPEIDSDDADSKPVAKQNIDELLADLSSSSDEEETSQPPPKLGLSKAPVLPKGALPEVPADLLQEVKKEAEPPKATPNSFSRPPSLAGSGIGGRPLPRPSASTSSIFQRLCHASEPKESCEREYMKKFFTEDLFNSIKAKKAKGEFTPMVQVPNTVTKPFRISNEYSDLIVELLNETVDTANLSGYSYNSFLDRIEQILNSGGQWNLKQRLTLSKDVPERATKEHEYGQIEALFDIADMLMKRELQNVLQN